jgi:hypothetical protein
LYETADLDGGRLAASVLDHDPSSAGHEIGRGQRVERARDPSLAVGRVDEDAAEATTASGETFDRTVRGHLEHLAHETRRLEVRVNGIGRRAARLDEDRFRCAATEGLEAERTRAREEVEDAAPGATLAAFENGKHGLFHPIGSRADEAPFGSAQSPPSRDASHDAHGPKLRSVPERKRYLHAPGRHRKLVSANVSAVVEPRSYP